MQKVKVAVIRGGQGESFKDSISSGANILFNLSKERYEPLDVWVSPEGLWHNNGVVVSPVKLLKQTDFVINTLISDDFLNTQRKLELFSIPHIGPSKLSTLFSMNKEISGELLEQAGIKTPKGLSIEVSNNLEPVFKKIFNEFMQPVFVSSVFLNKNKNGVFAYNYNEIKRNVERFFEFGHKVWVEQGIRGKRISCFTIDNFRGEDIYTTIEMEKLSHQSEDFVFPSRLGKKQKRQVSEISKLAHKTLLLKGYSKCNFSILKDKVYLLSIEPMPSLEKNSEMEKALNGVGCSTSVFLEDLISKEFNFAKL